MTNSIAKFKTTLYGTPLVDFVLDHLHGYAATPPVAAQPKIVVQPTNILLRGRVIANGRANATAATEAKKPIGQFALFDAELIKA
jgi:hypothetical protein